MTTVLVLGSILKSLSFLSQTEQIESCYLNLFLLRQRTRTVQQSLKRGVKIVLEKELEYFIYLPKWNFCFVCNSDFTSLWLKKKGNYVDYRIKYQFDWGIKEWNHFCKKKSINFLKQKCHWTRKKLNEPEY